MRILLICILLISLNKAFAQPSIDSVRIKEDYILNSKNYKPGIYKTFEEFKFNKPSIVDNYFFDKKRLWLTDPSSGKTKKIKRNDVWGFSDGTKIYVRQRKYNELVVLGRYCYFKEKGVRVIMGISTFPFMLVPIPVPYEDQVIINFNTGKSYLLTKGLLKTILTTDDPELWSEFQKEQKKQRKLFDYILKYNKRNVDKIK